MKNKIISVMMALMLGIGAFPVTALANAGGNVSTETIVVTDETDETDETYGDVEAEDGVADMQESIEVSVSEDGTMTYSYGGWTWTVGTGDYETAATQDGEESAETVIIEESTDETEASESDNNTALTGTVVGINSYLNLRSGAGTDYKVIGKLTNGTEVEVIGEENGWYEVVIPEMTGYVYSDYLEVVETVTEEEELDSMDEMFLLTLFSLLLQSGDTGEETSEALTPDGNLTLVDDIDTGTDEDAGKQFITVTTRSGNYFYLIIDRDDEGEETVHFLNQVDEADLLSLMDEEDVEEYEASLAANEEEAETEATTELVDEGVAETEVSEKENGNSLIALVSVLLLVVVLVAGVGFFAYTKVKSKKAEEEKPDPDADYDDDGGYDDYPDEYEDEQEAYYSDEDGSDFEDDGSM